ncbi:MAG: cyclic nucleotide-binding domain-containing protein [Deltaproteobacteria bacterium]|nr:cyclic nucleotide-binding domain-containing protein [Deltaproteobacteria bacterium]
MATTDELLGNRLFQDISVLNLERVLLISEEVVFAPGTRIFEEGEKADVLYVIREGVLDLTFRFKIGQVEGELTIDSKGRGESVGWSALVPPHCYTLAGVCRESLKVLVMDGDSLLKICRDDRDFGFFLMRNIAEIVGTRMKQLQAMFIQEVQRGIKMP